jgi:hypothetical protein
MMPTGISRPTSSTSRRPRGWWMASPLPMSTARQPASLH